MMTPKEKANFVDQYSYLCAQAEMLGRTGKGVPADLANSINMMEGIANRNFTPQEIAGAVGYSEGKRKQYIQQMLNHDKQTRITQTAEQVADHMIHKEMGLEKLTGYGSKHHQAALRGAGSKYVQPEKKVNRHLTDEQALAATRHLNGKGMDSAKFEEFMDAYAESNDPEKTLKRYGIDPSHKKAIDDAQRLYVTESVSLALMKDTPEQEIEITPDEERQAHIVEAMINDPSEEPLLNALNEGEIDERSLEDEGIRGDVARAVAAHE